MFQPYADRRPDPDAPIVPWLYGVQEWYSLKDLIREIEEVFGIKVTLAQEQAA